LIRASVNVDVACNVSWIRMTDALNTFFGAQHDFLCKVYFAKKVVLCSKKYFNTHHL